jgi:hypothetical protein
MTIWGARLISSRLFYGWVNELLSIKFTLAKVEAILQGRAKPGDPKLIIEAQEQLTRLLETISREGQWLALVEELEHELYDHPKPSLEAESSDEEVAIKHR